MIGHTNSTGPHTPANNAPTVQVSTHHAIAGQQDNAPQLQQLSAGFNHNSLSHQNRPSVIQHISSATPQNMAIAYNAHFPSTHAHFPHHNYVNTTQLPRFSQVFGINNSLYPNDGRQMYLGNPSNNFNGFGTTQQFTIRVRMRKHAHKPQTPIHPPKTLWHSCMVQATHLMQADSHKPIAYYKAYRYKRCK